MTNKTPPDGGKDKIIARRLAIWQSVH